MTEGFKKYVKDMDLDKLRLELKRLKEDNKVQERLLKGSRSRKLVAHYAHNIEVNNDCIKYIKSLIKDREKES